MDITKSSGLQDQVSNYSKISVLYLATTIHKTPFIAGGLLTHTQGVIHGFTQLDIPIIYAATKCMMHKSITQKISTVYLLKNPWLFSLLRWKINCLCSNIFFTWQVLKIIRKSIATHIYQRYTPFNCTGILLSKIKKIPCIIEYNGPEVWVLQNWSSKTLFPLLLIARLIEQFVLRHASCITVVSQVLKDELIQRGIDAKKILVNSNGVDEYTFNPQLFKHKRTSLRKKLVSEDTLIFGFIGTFNQWHGISIILELIKALKGRTVHFILIGDGPLYHSCAQEIKHARIEHNVTMPGMLEKNQAISYLAACDIFLCPTQKNIDGSRFFGSPTKLFEYMSLGKPVIASNLEQLQEIIKPAVTVQNLTDLSVYQTATGLLANSENIHEFIALAHHSMNLDTKVRECIGLNARQKILAHHTWRHHVENIIRMMSHNRDNRYHAK